MRSSSDTRRWPAEGLEARITTVAAAVAGAAVVGGVASSAMSSSAANNAAGDQEASAQAGINAQQQQFQQIQQLLSPYVQAGNGALSAQQNLVGLNGNGAQQSAISALQNSPAYTSMLAAGNNSILQNASATGGLRGGNTQQALATFSPQLLAQTIQQQYSNLSGLTNIGQNAAAGVGNAGSATTNNVTSLLQQQGAASAGNALAQGKAGAGLANSISSGIGGYASLGGFGSFGGYTSPVFNSTGTASGGEGIDPYGYLGGASTAGDFSDARLKTNIRRIGVSDKGNPLYEWTWKATGKKGRGVIAQEVAHVPGAVAEDPATGFLTVNYDRV